MCNCLKQEVYNLEYNQKNINNIDNQNFNNFNINLFSNEINEKKYNTNISPRENIIDIKKAAEYFIENFEKDETKNLIFTGGTGLGKTFLSNCIVNELLKQGKTVMYQTAPVMLENLISDLFAKPEKQTGISNNLLTVDLLVIDELAVGKVGLTDNQRKLFGNIIRSRSNQGKNTILVSNSTPYELKELIGEFAFESIKTYSSICPIELKGHNRRARNSDVLSSHGFGD
jgi:DNA replication protein DnaC